MGRWMRRVGRGSLLMLLVCCQGSSAQQGSIDAATVEEQLAECVGNLQSQGEAYNASLVAQQRKAGKLAIQIQRDQAQHKQMQADMVRLQQALEAEQAKNNALEGVKTPEKEGSE